MNTDRAAAGRILQEETESFQPSWCSRLMHNPGGMAADHADEKRRRIAEQRGHRGPPPGDAPEAVSLNKGKGRHQLDERSVGQDYSRLEKPERNPIRQRQEGEEKDGDIGDYKRPKQRNHKSSSGKQGQRRDAGLDDQRPERHDTEREQGLPVYHHGVGVNCQGDHQQREDEKPGAPVTPPHPAGRPLARPAVQALALPVLRPEREQIGHSGMALLVLEAVKVLAVYPIAIGPAWLQLYLYHARLVVSVVFWLPDGFGGGILPG